MNEDINDVAERMRRTIHGAAEEQANRAVDSIFMMAFEQMKIELQRCGIPHSGEHNGPLHTMRDALRPLFMSGMQSVVERKFIDGAMSLLDDLDKKVRDGS